MTEVALPRIRTKRKRKKPMPPHLAYLLCLLIITIVSLSYGVVKLSLGDTQVIFGLCIVIVAFAMLWPTVYKEWKAWRKDDD